MYNISLLIFCLDVLSMVEHKVLKSSTITVLLSLSAFSSINICFMYLSILMLSVCIHLQLLYPLDKLTLWLYLTHDSFWLIIYLSDVSIATPALFKLPFAWNIFYQCCTFSLCMSLKLKWVFCGQHIIQSFFFIHSATLYLLTGEFNPFKVLLIGKDLQLSF